MQSLFEIKFKGVQFKTLYPWTFNFTGSRQESRLAIHLEKDEAEQFGWIIGLQSPDNVSTGLKCCPSSPLVYSFFILRHP